MKNDPALDAATLLTWLNGRADKIEVCVKKTCYECMHTCYQGHECRPCPRKCNKGSFTEKVLLWQPEDFISIEQSILNFCDEHDIDIQAEAEPDVPQEEPEAAPALGKPLSADDQLKNWLLENDYIKPYKLGVGYGDDGHSCGLPHGYRVSCKWSSVDGKQSCLVTTTEVLVATLPVPYNHNTWRIIKRLSYNSTNELKAILDREIERPKGCWN